jgi:hypothetical protein
VRQHERAANHLIGVLGIDAQAHMNFNGLVELREWTFFRTPIASSNGIGRGSICFFAASYFFPAFAIV